MRTILIGLKTEARSKLRPRMVAVRGKNLKRGGIKTQRIGAMKNFKSLKVTPIFTSKLGKKLGDDVFKLEDYWADEAEGIAESTFCASDFNPTPLVRSRLQKSCNAYTLRLRKTAANGINYVKEPQFKIPTDSFNYTPTSFLSEPNLIGPSNQKRRADSQPPIKAPEEKIKQIPKPTTCTFENRKFTLYKDEDLPWTKEPILKKQSKLQFAPDCDYDSEPENIKKEQSKMLRDLKSGINKYIREDPLEQIQNLNEIRWVSQLPIKPALPKSPRTNIQTKQKQVSFQLKQEKESQDASESPADLSIARTVKLYPRARTPRVIYNAAF